MKDYKKIVELYFKSLEGFKEFESTPRDFGTGDLLYSSEIHTLQMIGKHPGINLTELSDKLHVSKSASSKFVKKLLDKQLITKSKVIENKKEVVFHLTDRGMVAYMGHEAFAKRMFGSIHGILGECSEEEAAFLEGFLEKLVTEVKKINRSDSK